MGIALDRSKWRSVISPKIDIFFLSLTPFGLENIDPRSPKLLTLKFTGVPIHLPSLVTLALIQGDSKNMSPLALKLNNSRPMSRTAFERADNFLSNEYIHTRFPFQITSSQAENQKSSGFCVFRFQTDFDEREHFVLSPLYRNIAFI